MSAQEKPGKTKVVIDWMIRILCANFIEARGAKIIPQLKSRIFNRNLIGCRCNIVHSRILGPNTYTKTHSCQATGNRKIRERCFRFIRWCSKILISRCVTSIFFAATCFDYTISNSDHKGLGHEIPLCCRLIGCMHCHSS